MKGEARPRSLRARLTLTYAVVLALGLGLFAALSLAAIDQTLKVTIDARMGTATRAFVATLREHPGFALDEDVRKDLLSILSLQQNGAVLLSDGSAVMESARPPRVVVEAAKATRQGTLAYATVKSPEATLRVASSVVVDADGRSVIAVVWRSLDVIADYERLAAIVSAGAIVAIMVLASLIGGALSRRSLKPLRALLELASEIEEHDLSRRLEGATQNDELGQLSSTFNRMLDRLQAAFERQRRFTADASHDLRAPLSVIRAEVDLALRAAGGSADDREAFIAIRTELVELESLLDDLLLVARADTGIVGRESIAIDPLVSVATDRIETFAASRSVRVGKASDIGAAVVGDRVFLERAFLAVLHNAAKFAPEGGRVEISAGVANGSVTYVVRDDGPGFSEEALARAFDRFWKEDVARGSSGSGLGLAIAKAAIERSGGSIRLRNAESGGAEVTIALETSRTGSD